MTKEELLSAYDANVEFLNHTIETIKDDETAKTLVFGALLHASAVISNFILNIHGVEVKDGESRGVITGEILIKAIEDDLKKIKRAHSAHKEQCK